MATISQLINENFPFVLWQFSLAQGQIFVVIQLPIVSAAQFNVPTFGRFLGRGTSFSSSRSKACSSIVSEPVRFLPLLQTVVNLFLLREGFEFPIDSWRAWLLDIISCVIVAVATDASWAGGGGGGCYTTSLSNITSPSSATKKLFFAT